MKSMEKAKKKTRSNTANTNVNDNRKKADGGEEDGVAQDGE